MRLHMPFTDITSELFMVFQTADNLIPITHHFTALISK
jgi:hypothetical protein